MHPQYRELLMRLMSIFIGSFINHNNELIVIPRNNTYFMLKDCQTEKDIIAKVLMWCSRTCYKAQPYKSKAKNRQYQELNTQRLSEFLGVTLSVEDVGLIYERLGNGIDKELTYQFIDSGYDMKILQKSKENDKWY